ncbi:DUF998 domain-containing protein [Nonomuraea sp. NPDC050310]|uniref:DUF998 domain-containing protein n=1 Tax=unclassified Nonomuraea TaxID=2593643 RepID=UPI0033D65A46
MQRAGQAGLAAVGVGSAVVVGLDLARLDEMSPIRRTISEHGLGPQGWIFAVAVALLALGSAAIAACLARRRLAGPVGTLALLAWSAGLLVAATFPKHNWAVGPSLSGTVHRWGSIVAFLSLPVAALIIARPWRHPEWRRRAAVAYGLGIGSVVTVLGIAAVMTVGWGNGLAWWQVMPLGLVERVLAAVEVATVIALGLWSAARADRGRSQGRSPAIRSST